MTLGKRIAELVSRHGSLRAVARITQIDGGYLSRLASGEKTCPSKTVLRKLGLKQRVDYRSAQRIGAAVKFETHCPDGQKCTAATTGCRVGQCQRKGTATCKHFLNLQAGESHTLTVGCPYCRAETADAHIGNAVEVLDSIRALLNGERHPDDAERIVAMINGFLESVRKSGQGGLQSNTRP